MSRNTLSFEGVPLVGTTAQRPAAANVPDGQFRFNSETGLFEFVDNIATPATPGWRPIAPVQAEEVTFTETGAGTYTGSVSVPAGATVLDVIVHQVALWGAASTAVLNVGDTTDPDGFFANVNLKATDLLAGESINFTHAGGRAGAYLAGSGTHWVGRYDAAAHLITGTVVSVGAGTSGRTRMTVVYCLPRVTAAVRA